MKITKFEDIESWKKARILTNDIYKVVSQSKLKSDFGLRDQIQRAAVSIMNNTCLPVGKSPKDMIQARKNHLLIF